MRAPTKRSALVAYLVCPESIERAALKVGKIDLPIPEIIGFVPFPDFAQDAAGIARGDDVRGEILRHDAARAHDGIVSDRDAGENDRARAYPAVSSDPYGDVELIGLFPQFGQDGVTRRGHGDVGAEHGIVSHRISVSSTRVRLKLA